MRLFLAALGLFIASGLCAAGEAAEEAYPGHRPTTCIDGCTDALGLVTYADVPKKAKTAQIECGSRLFAMSLYACIEAYCSSEDQAEGWTSFAEDCATSGYTLPSRGTVQQEMFGYKRPDPMSTIDGKAKANKTYVLPDYTSWYGGYHGENARILNHVYGHSFGWSMYLLFGVAVLVGILIRLFDRFAPVTPSEVAPSRGTWATVKTNWQRHIGTPALFGRRHAVAYGWMSIPTRLQSLFLGLYLLLNLIYCFVGYDIFDINLRSNYLYRKDEQLGRLIADRMGIMCIYNFPLVWLLAGRNDVFLWLTGWSYATANLFHRWVARITTIQCIIHSAAHTWRRRGKVAQYYQTEEYWRVGAAALVAMCLMTGLSVKPLRKRAYEVFLVAHIVLAIVALIMTFYHLKQMDGEFDAWVWTCTGLWGLDRLIRVMRMLVLSYKSAFMHTPNTVATACHSGLIRLTVTTTLQFAPSPGQNYFLYFPRSITPWQNHPFTLAGWEIHPGQPTKLHFLLAPRLGATRRLAKRLTKTQVPIPVLIEGPYGSVQGIGRYDHLLLVAGGSGITSILPYLVWEARAEQTRVKRVTVVWVVKNAEFAADVLARELAGDFAAFEYELQLYITAEEGASPQDVADAMPESPAIGTAVNMVLHDKSSSPSSSNNSSDRLDEKPTSHSKMRRGRPGMKKLVKEAIGHMVGAETLAVVSCGPAGMVDDMRKAVSEAYGDDDGTHVSAARLGYFEELFEW